MKKLWTHTKAGAVLIACLSFILGSCTTDPELELNSEEEDNTVSTRTGIGNDVYDPQTERWYEDFCDPFRTEIIAMARANLSDGSSPVRPENTTSLRAMPQTPSTHKVIRIKPRTLEELDEITENENIQSSSISPDWRPIEHQPDPPADWTDPFFEERFYYTEEIDEEEEIEEEEPSMLPVLYAVWPNTIPLPSEMIYEPLYEVVMLNYSNPWHEYIEKEAVRIVFGSLYTGFGGSDNPSGRIRVWDDILGMYIPVANVRLVGKVGSKTSVTHTDNDGKYEFTNVSSTGVGDLVINWYGNGFKVCTTGNNSFETPIKNGFRKNLDYKIDKGWREYVIAHIWRAANVFVNHDHGLNKSLPDPVFKIRLYDGNDRPSAFYYPNTHITIRKKYTQESALSIFGTALHELGHAGMYAQFATSSGYKGVELFIRESWAVFVSWYLTNWEYERLGYQYRNEKTTYTTLPEYYVNSLSKDRIPSPWTVKRTLSDYQDFNLVGHGQNKYSPLFIDLLDDYNQALNKWIGSSNNFMDYPNDRITLPLNVVKNLGLKFSSYDCIKEELYGMVGRYGLATGDLNDFFSFYDKVHDNLDGFNYPLKINLSMSDSFGIDGNSGRQYTFKGRAVKDIEQTAVEGTWRFNVECPPGKNYRHAIDFKDNEGIKVTFKDAGTYVINAEFQSGNKRLYTSRPIVIDGGSGITSDKDSHMAGVSNYFYITGLPDINQIQNITWSVTDNEALISNAADIRLGTVGVTFSKMGQYTLTALVKYTNSTEHTYTLDVDVQPFTDIGNMRFIWSRNGTLFQGDIVTVELDMSRIDINSIVSTRWTGTGVYIQSSDNMSATVRVNSVNRPTPPPLQGVPLPESEITVGATVTFRMADGSTSETRISELKKVSSSTGLRIKQTVDSYQINTEYRFILDDGMDPRNDQAYVGLEWVCVGPDGTFFINSPNGLDPWWTFKVPGNYRILLTGTARNWELYEPLDEINIYVDGPVLSGTPAVIERMMGTESAEFYLPSKFVVNRQYDFVFESTTGLGGVPYKTSYWAMYDGNGGGILLEENPYMPNYALHTFRKPGVYEIFTYIGGMPNTPGCVAVYRLTITVDPY